MNRLFREQRLPLDLEQAWDFFSDPGNLCRITPQWLCFQVCGGPCQRMYAGQILRYTIRPFPAVRATWVTEITHVREPHFFVDEQRLGPYRFWHHQHRFAALPAAQGGGVLMQDEVHYALPLGPLGGLVDRFWVAGRLREIFDFRERTLRELFG